MVRVKKETQIRIEGKGKKEKIRGTKERLDEQERVQEWMKKVKVWDLVLDVEHSFSLLCGCPGLSL